MKRKAAALIMVLLLCGGGCSGAKNGSSDAASAVQSEVSATESAQKDNDKSEGASGGTESTDKSSVDESGSDAPAEDHDKVFNDKAFLFFRTHDRLYRQGFSADVEDHTGEYSSVMQTENGELISVRASGHILDGGFAGYDQEPFFDSIDSQERITPQQAAEQFDIPELKDITALTAYHTIMKHTMGDMIYIITQTDSFDLYLNSVLLGTIDKDTVYGSSDPQERVSKLIEFVESHAMQ